MGCKPITRINSRIERSKGLILFLLFFTTVSQSKELIVGITQTPPMIYVDSTSNVAGVFADILAYIAAEEGWRINYRKGSLHQCLKWLDSGSIDLMADLGYSDTRSSRFLFSDEDVIPTWAQIFVPKGSDIKTFSDLHNKTIVVEKDDYFWIDPKEGFRHLMMRLGLQCTIREVPDYSDVFEVLARGEAHAGIVNRIYGDILLSHFPIEKTGIVFSPVSLRFAFPKNRALSDTLKSIIDVHVIQLKSDANSLYHKSLVKHISSPEKLVIPVWLTLAGISLFFLLVFLAVLTLFLKRQVSRKERAFRSTQRRLNDSVRKYEETCGILPVAICETDNSFRISFVNKRACEVFGLESHDMEKGIYLSDLFPDDAWTQARKDFEDVLAGGILGTKEYAISRKDGKSVWVLANITAVRNDTNVSGLRIGLFDISDKKDLEQRFIHSQKMESIGQLAGGVAHDFNNILGGITGNADLLRMHLDPESKPYVNAERIMDAAMKASGLTRQLLLFSRKNNTEMVRIDIHETIESAVSMLRHTLDKRITVLKNLDASKHSVNGDAGHIENVLLNLGINARDAMPNGGVITFSTANVFVESKDFLSSEYETAVGDYCVIMVIDSGTGIDTGTMEHIFEPFFTTKDPGKGTGLGLASVYSIVRQHSGYVTVQSQKGKGSTFSLYFPLCADESPKVSESSRPVYHRRNHNVLVVDDDKIVRNSTVEILSDLGYHVSSCSDGEEALRFYNLQWRDVDIVLLDMIMPKMNGLKCLRGLKKINPDVRVLVTSGYIEEVQRSDALREGAIGILQKPFQFAELSKKIDDILTNTSSDRHLAMNADN